MFFETFIELNSLPYESCNKNNAKFKLGIDKNVKRYTKEEAELYGVVKQNEIKTLMTEKADLTFQMMMQIRNKIISAYEEIMRMQV